MVLVLLHSPSANRPQLGVDTAAGPGRGLVGCRRPGGDGAIYLEGPGWAAQGVQAVRSIQGD